MQVGSVQATAAFTLCKAESLMVFFPENLGLGGDSLTPLTASALRSWLLLPYTQKYSVTSVALLPELALHCRAPDCDWHTAKTAWEPMV